MNTLSNMYDSWHEWSLSAERNEDGWESDFPGWSKLMAGACSTMTGGDLSPDQMSVLAKCWSISEETEDLLDFAAENIDACWPVVSQLTESELAACRWQVYEAAASVGKRAEPLLRRGLEDEDGYVRRRAVLALARISPDDSEILAIKLINDSDPYIRQASLEMARYSKDRMLLNKISSLLAEDQVQHVRDAAKRALLHPLTQTT